MNSKRSPKGPRNRVEPSENLAKEPDYWVIRGSILPIDEESDEMLDQEDVHVAQLRLQRINGRHQISENWDLNQNGELNPPAGTEAEEESQQDNAGADFVG